MLKLSALFMLPMVDYNGTYNCNTIHATLCVVQSPYVVAIKDAEYAYVAPYIV